MHKSELNEEEMGGVVSAEASVFHSMGKTQLSEYMVFGGHDVRVIQNDGSLDSVIYWVSPNFICWSVNPRVWVYLEIGPLKIIKIKCGHKNGALIQ